MTTEAFEHTAGSIAVYRRYWGKAQPGLDQPNAFHLLAYHALDVAAVGLVYLQRRPKLVRRFARRFGVSESLLLSWIVFFLAIHDLGKFAQSFQGKRPDLLTALQGVEPTKFSAVRHDSLGYHIWVQQLRTRLRDENWFAFDAPTRTSCRPWDDWFKAVTGHHGQPPDESTHRIDDAFSSGDTQAVDAFVDAMRKLLLPQGGPTGLEVDRFVSVSKTFSWWLAGIAVLADWLGSNTDYFPYCDDVDLALDTYWERAQRQAERAVTESGVIPAGSSVHRGYSELFEFSDATPLQTLASTLPLGDGPQLLIFEDVTGAGKTEAALMAAHRLLAEERAEGLYFALPTMATANSMYGRLHKVCLRLFQDDAQPSLVLAHGGRDLNARFRESVMPTPRADFQYGEERNELESANARCTAWLADSRKKALLAQVGVGTVDQALLGAIQAKHQSLRLLGLLGKVLIVDEVHANDAYMHKLLCNVLKFHAAGGGHAILLSATLPLSMRQELAKSFREGLGLPPVALDEMAYPLCTRIGDDAQPDEIAVDTRQEVKRRVRTVFVDNTDEVIRRIVQAVDDGRCVCWIRNTVADAREAWAALQAHLPEDRLTLFHARFTMGQRQRIEENIVSLFGPDGGPDERRGRVVVSTQVVEQSLDLDFDLMVTDLAPIDLIIQRAGRLCRHVRDLAGMRLPRGQSDGRGTPELIIHGPSPDGPVAADWYSAVFPGAAKVYPNHAQLWIGARALMDRGGFAMPDDARDLIEAVYGGQAEAPDALQQTEHEAVAMRGTHAAMARLVTLCFDEGYSRNDGWCDDMIAGTRLGEPDAILRLAVFDGESWKPLEQQGRFSWEMSQVKTLKKFVSHRAPLADSVLEAAAVAAEAALPDRGKWSVLLPLTMEEAGEWSGEVLDATGKVAKIHYHLRTGLLISQ